MTDARETVTQVPKLPSQCVPEPDAAIRKQIPGAYAAWQGLNALPLKVSHIRGPTIVIVPDNLAQFQHAPLRFIDSLNVLERDHKEYKDLLAFMAHETTPNNAKYPRRVKEEPEAIS